MTTPFDLIERLLRRPRRQGQPDSGLSRPEMRGRAFELIERCDRLGLRIIGPGSLEWSERLDLLDPPPICLFARGAPLDLAPAAPTLAVVGSRSPTAYGTSCCERLVAPLARAGVRIWSGLARGIDESAHRCALEVGGRSCAVIGSGHAKLYPAGSEPLVQRLCESGTVLSEYPPDQGARRHHFPRRNGILAAYGHDVLVIQAAARSGSLLTAWRALDLGGTVLAVPDRIDEDLGRGGLELLKQGAAPVADAEDVRALLGWQLDEPTPVSAEDPVLRCLAEGSRSLDELTRVCEGSLSRTLAILARHELAGRVKRGADGRFLLTCTTLR